MTELTSKAYLAKLCNRINNSTNGGVLYIKRFDDVIEQYLDSEHATWLQKSRSGGKVWIPRYNYDFYIVRANESARGYKPRKAIIDSRIELETIQLIIEPSLIICTECAYF